MTFAKLTITIPEDLRQRAKCVAALRKENLSDIVRAALEQYLAEVMDEADDIRAVQEVEERISRGEVGIKDWAELEAELDALPD